MAAFIFKKALSTYYSNKTRKILLVVALVVSIVGFFTAQGLGNSSISIFIPFLQALIGYVYFQNIKEFTLKYMTLVQEGFTFKEKMSRMEASRTY